ncbi:hypothetical protein MLD38_010826 [Melastoma candidum]|uniref:Uncharacterized protein n=1 Tax=Melastoma candidum TaxID=119954 RepID=A0ACB9R591_9MYRT|nr:hypothetical protein MLD38_010826 [Melastoma candidum]
MDEAAASSTGSLPEHGPGGQPSRKHFTHDHPLFTILSMMSIQVTERLPTSAPMQGGPVWSCLWLFPVWILPPRVLCRTASHDQVSWKGIRSWTYKWR